MPVGAAVGAPVIAAAPLSEKAEAPACDLMALLKSVPVVIAVDVFVLVLTPPVELLLLIMPVVAARKIRRRLFAVPSDMTASPWFPGFVNGARGMPDAYKVIAEPNPGGVVIDMASARRPTTAPAVTTNEVGLLTAPAFTSS